MLNRAVAAHLTIWQMQQDILHCLTMWNIALGRIATAIGIRSFLTLGSVNQNDQLILDHFALVRVRGANPRAALGLGRALLLPGLLLRVAGVHLGILTTRLIWLLLLRRLLLLLLMLLLTGLIVHVWIVHLVWLILSWDVLIHAGSAHGSPNLRVHVRVHIHAVHGARLLHHNVRWAHVGRHLAHWITHVAPANWLLIDIAQQLLDMRLRVVWLGIRGELRKVTHLLGTGPARATGRHAGHAEVGAGRRTGLPRLGTGGDDAPRAAIGRGRSHRVPGLLLLLATLGIWRGAENIE